MLKSSMLLTLLSILTISCFSQVQFQAIASYLKGAGYYDNHNILLGGGFSMRYMYKEKFFVGGSLKTYHAATTAYETYNTQDKIKSNIEGVVDVVFRKRKPVQPYLGLGVGASSATHMVNYIRVNRLYTMFSARGGSLFTIGKSTGFFAQAEYHYSPGDGGPFPLDGIRNPVLTEPVSKYITIDVGLWVRLYLRP